MNKFLVWWGEVHPAVPHDLLRAKEARGAAESYVNFQGKPQRKHNTQHNSMMANLVVLLLLLGTTFKTRGLERTIEEGTHRYRFFPEIKFRSWIVTSKVFWLCPLQFTTT